ncbi:patatin-like phospholipase family protein [Myxococcota bacterium]|nr:patatin-like phospholipase family protein [Myxococcota bacterium]
MSTLRASLWASPLDWPELALPEVRDREPIGLCFSGGGSRALAAAWGQLRALRHLGVLDRARYISGVSGGSWASGIYTFQRVTDEETFLGPLLAPEDLSLDALSEPLTTESLGFAATRNVWGFLAEALVDHQVPPDRLWADVIGRHMLAPYGLFNHDNPEAVVPTDAYGVAARARPGNEAVMASWTLRAPARAPYLVVGACVLGPESMLPLAVERPAPIDLTPLYCGVPAPVTGVFQRRDGALARLKDRLQGGDGEPTLLAAPIGGVVVESLAFGGGPAPAVTAEQALPAPAAPWSLADLVGASSSAWAGVLEEAPGLGRLHRLAPCVSLWPGWSWETPPDTRFALGDGGILENYGLITLLRRGVDRAIVLINTSTPLETDWDPQADEPTGERIDAYLPGLFGRPQRSLGTTTVDNMIFPTAELAPLVTALQAAKRAGEPVMALRTHRLLHNAWWGVDGGREVKVLWVYLDHARQWEDQLQDADLRDAIHAGNRRLLPTGPLKHFPHYKTSGENVGGSIALTDVQASALAALTSWGLTQREDLVRALLDGEAARA